MPCVVCGKNNCKLFSTYSSLVPIILDVCNECLLTGAEPTWAVTIALKGKLAFWQLTEVQVFDKENKQYIKVLEYIARKKNTV